jgi:prepilin-type N-terminal cleavage/methylation domain-containing protein
MNIKSKKGVTLIEVIAAVAIMAIIIIPISLVFTTSYMNFIKESDKTEAQKSARAVLYGKGFDSYGVIGDLERSDAISSSITIGDMIDSSSGHSITIIEYSDNGTKIVKTTTYYYDSVNHILKQKISDNTGNPVSDEDYFKGEESTNGNTIEVTDFVVKRVAKGTDVDATTTDADLINITATVTCGQSGGIKLQSSYRIPDIER